MDGHGFTPDTWSRVAVFLDRCATPHDVDSAAAVFALTDTWNARPLAVPLPQPVIWWRDDAEELGAVAVQAEAHETDDGETLELVGLLLADGGTAVALLEDVDLVDGSDPVWRALAESMDDIDAEEIDDNDQIDADFDLNDPVFDSHEPHARFP